MNDQNTKAYFAWGAVSIIWGTTYLAIKIGVADLPPFLFAGLRWLIAGPIFLVFLYARKFKMPALKELKQLAIIGILLLGITNALVVYAEKWMPSGLTALILSTMPLWVVVTEIFISGFSRINFKIIAGIILGICGVSLIFMQDINSFWGEENITGIVLLTLANISWASGSHYSKRHKLNIHPLTAAAVQMIIAGVFQVAAGLINGEYSSFHFTHDSFYAFAYLVIIASILGYGSYIYAIAHLPVSFVTTYAYINPVIALFLGWVVLGESLNIIIGFSALIILSGVYLVQKGAVKS